MVVATQGIRAIPKAIRAYAIFPFAMPKTPGTPSITESGSKRRSKTRPARRLTRSATCQKSQKELGGDTKTLPRTPEVRAQLFERIPNVRIPLARIDDKEISGNQDARPVGLEREDEVTYLKDVDGGDSGGDGGGDDGGGGDGDDDDVHSGDSLHSPNVDGALRSENGPLPPTKPRGLRRSKRQAALRATR